MKKNFLSLAWFMDKLNLSQKSKKEKKEKKENLDVEKKILYKGIKLINNSLTIVLSDGSILSKPCATEDDFNACVKATTLQKIIEIISDKVSFIKQTETDGIPMTQKEINAINKGYSILENIEDFTFDGNSVYWIVPNRSLPQQLVEALCKLVYNEGLPLSKGDLDNYEEYLSLKKFWLKCCLNPNAQSAEDLYTFLSNHKFKIDRHGNFYAYRKVVTREDNTDKEIAEFISNTYVKVKAVWKYNPKNYSVLKRDGIYSITDNRKSTYDDKFSEFAIGNLAEMYESISTKKNASYTSAHTRMEDYRIGEVISMPRNEGDDNNNVSCSTGFHAASKKYDYSGFGDCPILMIINPTDVLSVPKGEVGKLRTCRWFFACVLTEEEKYILDEEAFDVTDLGDLFEAKTQENIREYIHNTFAEEIKRHTFSFPVISSEIINNIIISLEGMQRTIKFRVENL